MKLVNEQMMLRPSILVQLMTVTKSAGQNHATSATKLMACVSADVLVFAPPSKPSWSCDVGPLGLAGSSRVERTLIVPSLAMTVHYLSLASRQHSPKPRRRTGKYEFLMVYFSSHVEKSLAQKPCREYHKKFVFMVLHGRASEPGSSPRDC